MLTDLGTMATATGFPFRIRVSQCDIHIILHAPQQRFSVMHIFSIFEIIYEMITSSWAKLLEANPFSKCVSFSKRPVCRRGLITALIKSVVKFKLVNTLFKYLAHSKYSINVSCYSFSSFPQSANQYVNALLLVFRLSLASRISCHWREGLCLIHQETPGI